MNSRFLMFAASCLLWAGVALAQININTATREELDSLKGIGEARANAIIKYREENGPFKSVSELKNIPNFPDSLVGKLRNKITVSGASHVPAPKAATRPPEKPMMVPVDKPLAREPARPAAPAMPAKPAMAPRSAAVAPAAPAVVKPAAPTASAAPARPAMPGKPSSPPSAPAKSDAAETQPAAAASKPAAPTAPAAPGRPAMPRPAQPAMAN
jgi:competence protein ComEA